MIKTTNYKKHFCFMLQAKGSDFNNLRTFTSQLPSILSKNTADQLIHEKDI